MPKLLTAAEREIGEDVVRTTREIRHPWTYLLTVEVEELINKYNAERVGDGAECVVIGRRGKPEEVVAFTYENLEPNEAKKLFYLHRICSTLFPHNFPHFAAGIGTVREEATATGTVRQRIRRDELRPNQRSEIKYPLDTVLCVTESLRMPIWIDTTKCNYILGTGGGEYYLDTVKLTDNEKPWNLPAIRKFMDEAKDEESNPTYTKRDKRIVEKSIRRLAALGLTKIVE
jgi:hypothetical protein